MDIKTHPKSPNLAAKGTSCVENGNFTSVAMPRTNPVPAWTTNPYTRNPRTTSGRSSYDAIIESTKTKHCRLYNLAAFMNKVNVY